MVPFRCNALYFFYEENNVLLRVMHFRDICIALFGYKITEKVISRYDIPTLIRIFMCDVDRRRITLDPIKCYPTKVLSYAP